MKVKGVKSVPRLRRLYRRRTVRAVRAVVVKDGRRGVTHFFEDDGDGYGSIPCEDEVTLLVEAVKCSRKEAEVTCRRCRRLEGFPPLPRSEPPRDGCGGVRDYWGEFDCSYRTTIVCEDCMYGPRAPRGKNPQAARNLPPVRVRRDVGGESPEGEAQD